MTLMWKMLDFKGTIKILLEVLGMVEISEVVEI